jgi:hypothetical protein
MTEQVNTENQEQELQSNRNDYPEVFSKEDIAKDEASFMSSVAAASEGIPEERIFQNFYNLSDIPDGFEVMIEPRDEGSFKGKPALFVYSIPTFEAIQASGEQGKEFIRDALAATLNRKASSYAWAVNRDQGAFNAPTDLVGWLEASKPKSSGSGVRFSRKAWNAISEILVTTINELYKKNKYPAKINKRELVSCMSSAGNAEILHPVIKAWDKLFQRAEVLITEHCESDTELSLEKELAVLKHWQSTREQQAAPEELEITDLDFGSDESDETSNMGDTEPQPTH